jgi:hypothetical protein
MELLVKNSELSNIFHPGQLIIDFVDLFLNQFSGNLQNGRTLTEHVVQVSGAGQQIKVIFGKVKWQGKKKDKKSSRPEENHLAFKQLNVLIVITFHIHGNLSLTGLALR